METIQVGDRVIGHGAPPLIVAEVGINHNGDVDLAKKTIDAAADAGMDAVKFQNYATEDFVTDRSLTLTYEQGGRVVSERQFELFRRCELSSADLRRLAACCDARKVAFHSTPTSVTGINALVRLGACVLKNGSDFLTHLPLIRAMGETGLPTVLSTGMATLGEIEDSVTAFRETGNDKLILLHCVSAYPTPARQANLKRIATLRNAFGCPTGFSDHTQGIGCAIAAVALGACWIEKHVTLDRALPGPDHRFSADPAEMAALVRGAHDAFDGLRALGDGDMAPADSECMGRKEFRLSCVAARDLPVGHVLSADDIAFQRPGTGLPPSDQSLLVGRPLNHAIDGGRVIRFEDVT